MYVATRTAAIEEIAMAAFLARKHVLVEICSRASVFRVTDAPVTKDVAFMDATHFGHDRRIGMIQAAQADMIGLLRSLDTCFTFPSGIVRISAST